MTDRQTVEVFVRLRRDENPDARQLSFRIPDGLSQAELLKHEWAIDGRDAVKVIQAYTNEDDVYLALPELLLGEQMDLVNLLNTASYDVDFK